MNCQVINCRRVTAKDGYCKEHWRQWQQGTLRPGRIAVIPKLCCITGCTTIHAAKGYCIKHYTQYKKGTLGKVSTKQYTSRAGLSKTVEYRAWYSMIDRCTNKANKDYPRYRGADITVSSSWLKSFEQFYIDMGNRPEDKSLDRKDNSKGYSKENCRWATRKEQANNTCKNIIDFSPFDTD